jgi:predicted small secreted protein
MMRKYLTILLAIGLAVSLSACSNKTPDAGSDVVKQGGVLAIPVGEITGEVKYYNANVDDVPVEVLAVKAQDGTIRTAYNTCQVCNGSPKAYFVQKDDVLECQNCGNQFPMERVGIIAGGCNPVPIMEEERSVTADSITIPYETLTEAKILFSRKK